MVSRERVLQLTDPQSVVVVTATRLEAHAVRSAAPSLTVIRAGIGLKRTRTPLQLAVSCGLAGALRTDLPTGTVLVPRRVGIAGRESIQCDHEIVETLIEGARRIGIEAVTLPLLTSSSLITGEERRVWAARGYGGADMESGYIDAERLACVRVVLDTPTRELSAVWLQPLRALLHPPVWRELPFLAQEGPRCARLAARVIASALQN